MDSQEKTVTNRILMDRTLRLPQALRYADRYVRAGEPFLVTGTKARARKLIARTQAKHPEIPVHVIARMDRTAPWIAAFGFEPKSAFRMLSDGGPIETIIVTPTPTMADQVAAARRAYERYYGQSV